MDERVKAGLKAGVISWIALIMWPLAFLMAGVMAVEFGKAFIRNQEDVALSSLTAGMSCVVLYSFIRFMGGEIFIAVVVFPFIAGIFSLIGGAIYAEYRLGISIDVQKLARIPEGLQNRLNPPAYAKRPVSKKFPKKFCPGCGRKIEIDWKVCPYCREELGFNVCPHCGYMNPSAVNRCQRCGVPFRNGTVTYDDGTQVY